MKTCIELKDLAFPVKLEQHANGDFKITYRQQIDDNLDYHRATQAFGQCVFHALSCDGKLDNGYGQED